jgi:hypothetical protein
MPTLPKRAVHLSALLVVLLVAAALLLCALRPALAGGSEPVNPEVGEYYTLYCANDGLEVWRSTPATELLETVPLPPIFLLPEGGELALVDSMTLERRTGDTLAVLGANGNAAPAAGEKVFTLAECIARNGGVPELPDEEDPPPPEDDEIGCLLGCAFCPACVLGTCVESPSLPGYDPFCALDHFGGCPVECLDLCLGLPIPLFGSSPFSAGAPRAKPADPASSGLELLFAVRSQVLSPTPKGIHYRDVFYAHHGEILRLLAANWGRWKEAFDLLVRFQPHLLALVTGRGAEVVLSADDVTAVEDFLDHLASPASTELAAALAAERTDAQLLQFVGQTMEDARRVLIGPASCPDAPDPACTAGFAKSSLLVDERKAGKEKVVAKLGKGPALVQTDFGDPTLADPSDVSLCIYDSAGALAGALGVARGGELCGKRPCWKPIGGAAPGGKGFAYKDKLGLADGFRSISLKSGAAGKSSLAASAGNQQKKQQTRLPDGIAAGLAATPSATVQLRTPGGCFAAELSQVVKQEPGLFQAR